MLSMSSFEDGFGPPSVGKVIVRINNSASSIVRQTNSSMLSIRSITTINVTYEYMQAKLLYEFILPGSMLKQFLIFSV